ncbi:E3 ubiquitin-protein ligase UPL6-like [Cucumis sativus]|uniref:E3 ubiquitin-protein ligase UPL6-like n=1 Tax=Cucumis sativus TaxID=3659 RepID=UPI0012F4E507|nr:E3 ubiquitin-protein ligase UPL6-like [Cucumis sativus]
MNDYFISQAVIENTRANDIHKRVPFLVPLTSRVKIFTTQLAAARQRNGSLAVFARNRFRIRRNHILEDAFSQMSALSEVDLRGSIRVSFVNEFGVEEAGIDGGGIFKDVMENITRQPLTCSMVYLRLSRHSLLLAWHGFVNPVVLLDNMKRDETAIVV